MSDQHEIVRPYAVGANSESNAKHNESGELLTESWMRVYQNIKVHHSPNSCLSTFGLCGKCNFSKIENILQQNRMHCN